MVMSSKKLDERLVSLTAPTSLEAEQYQALRLKLESLHRSRGVARDGDHEPGRQRRKVDDGHQPGRRAGPGLGRARPSDRSRSSAALGGAVSRGSARSRLRDWPTSFSTHTDTLRDAIVEAKPHKFDVVLAGSTAAPIHELFRSPRLEALLQEAREQYDYVVLDTPPLGPVSDCALLARWVDGVLLVVAAHRTSRKLLEEALNLLEGASVLGIVFNGDDRAFLKIPPALLSRLLFRSP